MMLITREQLAHIMPNSKRLDDFLSPLNGAMAAFNIDSPKRIAAFLAQIAHESGELRYTRELASGKAYEGRKDLGNTEPGDGPRYKGRGLMQITGRDNYKAISRASGIDFLAEPELLETPTWAAWSAAWFWDSRHLNSLADLEDFKAITKKINGGYNGLVSRETYYKRALEAFSVQFTPTQQETTVPIPFLAAAVPALISALPEFAKIFSKPDVAERNTEALVKATETIMAATGTQNIQAATEAIQSDPGAAQKANEALRVNRAEIVDMIERINAMEQGNIKAAWERNEKERPVVGQFKFIHLLSSLLVIFTGSFAWAKFDKLDPAMQSMVMTAIIIGGFTAVIGYWLGSSSGSDRKTDLLKKD